MVRLTLRKRDKFHKKVMISSDFAGTKVSGWGRFTGTCNPFMTAIWYVISVRLLRRAFVTSPEPCERLLSTGP